MLKNSVQSGTEATSEDQEVENTHAPEREREGQERGRAAVVEKKKEGGGERSGAK